ncbi:MAG: DUF4881 domain-containing protein [Deltaproteobacteria bacterium]|nr:DUF4881 domain-containing protein [Deltaproteobacteria bacterium]
MSIKRNGMLSMALILPVVLLMGCQFGKVDQGRVIKYDKDKKVVTMIRDGKGDTQNPDYNYLPPIVYETPADPHEMGPEPKAGQRMKLDTKNNQIVIFDAAAQQFKTIPYTLIEQKEGVGKDDPAVAGRKFPEVDKAKKTIAVYSSRQKILTTFSLPEEYFALPDSTWDAGDEIRVYYKQDGKALRMMNISKTDIYKK